MAETSHEDAYGTVRRWAGALLFGTGVLVILLEPFTKLHPDPFQLGLLFGTGLLLLGVEAGRGLLR